jgi:DNA-binding MarR family transcriptional regulator
MTDGIDMTPSEPSASGADDLTQIVRRLDMALAAWHGGLSEEMGMGASEVMALAHLASDENLGPSELAQRLRITTGATTALLDRLAARGHVVRERHPADRRKVVLRLTAQAHAEARLRMHPMATEITELAARLSPEERRAVGRFLEDLGAILQRHTDEPPSS